MFYHVSCTQNIADVSKPLLMITLFLFIATNVSLILLRPSYVIIMSKKQVCLLQLGDWQLIISNHKVTHSLQSLLDRYLSGYCLLLPTKTSFQESNSCRLYLYLSFWQWFKTLLQFSLTVLFNVFNGITLGTIIDFCIDNFFFVVVFISFLCLHIRTFIWFSDTYCL